jgi:hypothetical protein
MVRIIVYDAPTGAPGACGCGCGGHHHHGRHSHEPDDPLKNTNMEMQTRALALTLEKAYPGQVTVEYINVLKDPRGPRLPQTTLLCSLTYPTPLVYVNDRGRFAGSLPVERIKEEVASLLKEAT